MDLLSIFVKTCPDALGWGCMLWPIIFPAIIGIVVVIIWWLVAGAKVKSDNSNRKDYSAVLYTTTVLLLVILGGVYLYLQHKLK